MKNAQEYEADYILFDSPKRKVSWRKWKDIFIGTT